MPKFKDLNPRQKRKILREEYLSDGADESFVNELIPSDDPSVNTRLKYVFGYTDDLEVEIGLQEQ